MGRTTKAKQIRVFVEPSAYLELKAKAKVIGMDLQHYAGLYLSGYRVTKSENEVK